MNVEEIRKLKAEAELDILKFISTTVADLVKATCVDVDRVDVETCTVETMGGSRRTNMRGVRLGMKI